jgi:hypothetical protein
MLLFDFGMRKCMGTLKGASPREYRWHLILLCNIVIGRVTCTPSSGLLQRLCHNRCTSLKIEVLRDWLVWEPHQSPMENQEMYQAQYRVECVTRVPTNVGLTVPFRDKEEQQLTPPTCTIISNSHDFKFSDWIS